MAVNLDALLGRFAGFGGCFLLGLFRLSRSWRVSRFVGARGGLCRRRGLGDGLCDRGRLRLSESGDEDEEKDGWKSGSGNKFAKNHGILHG